MTVELEIRVADAKDLIHSNIVSEWYRDSSAQRGTGIAQRKPEYLEQKILRGNAIIAFADEELAGFCYIETFSAGTYVSNSGLIVRPSLRGRGIAKKIKQLVFSHAREKYPEARVFGITTSDIVMKINSDLGYIPVSFAQLTSDEEFWKGCNSCSNYDILLRNQKSLCLCTGMLAPSKSEQLKPKSKTALSPPTQNPSKNES